jgi:serine/threonine protein kinase
LENILISKTKRSGVHRAMVIDFGFAGHIPTPSFRFTDHPGSVCYAAPELLAGKPYDGKKVDVYALGVTLYVMIHGCYPFYNQNTTELYRMIWHEVCALQCIEVSQQQQQQQVYLLLLGAQPPPTIIACLDRHLSLLPSSMRNSDGDAQQEPCCSPVSLASQGSPVVCQHC